LNILHIYFDFSGYSDMACGISKLFGIRITNNFAFPFFATNISDFWKRWHISLSSWIMTYVFTPLSFILRKYGKAGIAIAIFVSFITVGIWHGLTMNYIIFGILHGSFFLPLVLKGGSIHTTARSQSALKNVFSMVGMFMLISTTSLFFRSIPVKQTFNELFSIFTHPQLDLSNSVFHGSTNLLLWGIIIGSLALEFFHKTYEHALSIGHYNALKRWSIYGVLFVIIFFYGLYPSDNFVYVQF
jgi:alginate O-acetyltransferase complex protein AlgI